jgi:phosphoribosylamine--glycine ligase
MNILLLGSGGREHALAWKLSQSPLCQQLYIAPGNPGTAQCGINVNLPINEDFEIIEAFCRDKSIQLLVVGPEEPLVKGITDYFREANRRNPFANGWLGIIGPSAYAAQLEGSKAFAKQFMQRHGIPTASYREFTSEQYEDAAVYVASHTLPIVLKADGLAAGKGVLICQTHEEALLGLKEMLQEGKFGAAGSQVVIEQFLTGIELSVFALTDGKDYVLLPSAKDYKRIGAGDTGLNTGGMGAVSPVPFADDVFMKKVEERIVKPTIKGIASEKMDYTGFVFFGLIKVGDDPYVIEYNCRMGDPETEAVMPRLQTDLVQLLKAAAEQRLAEMQVASDPRFAVTRVAVSGGYPGEYKKGFVIEGLKNSDPKTLVFHAGTKAENEQIVTQGGRVLAVTAYGASVADAAKTAALSLANIHFEGMYYRPDIGYEFL